jgi:CO dehydrogenase/acetyl-CoA synthase alpha subunit
MSKRGSKTLRKYTSISWEASKLVNKRKSRVTKSVKRKIKEQHLLEIKRKFLNEISNKLDFKIDKNNAVKYRKIEKIFISLTIKQINKILKDVNLLTKNNSEKKYSLFEFFEM